MTETTKRGEDQTEAQKKDEEVMLAKLSEAIRKLPDTARLDPEDVAQDAGIDPMHAIGLLRMLQNQGLGEIKLRVMDPANPTKEIGVYTNIHQIPPFLKDAEGKSFATTSDAIDMVFIPKQGLKAIADAKPGLLKRLMRR